MTEKEQRRETMDSDSKHPAIVEAKESIAKGYKALERFKLLPTLTQEQYRDALDLLDNIKKIELNVARLETLYEF
jgi:hypothetical protein